MKIYLLMALAAIIFAVALVAIQPGEVDALTHDTCDEFLCLGMDDGTENRIRVERKVVDGETVWGSEVWRIRVLRDTSVERFGSPCAPDACNYDSSQKGKHRAMTYDYQCVDGESEIGVYVQYFKGNDLATLPHFDYPDGWSIFEVYDQTIKLPVSC